jgi:hypothetical protein
MPNNIILKKSSVVDKVPLPGDLQFGELALNFADGNLFYKTSANAITTIASNKFVSVTGNITGGNILTAGLISATGNITGGNIVTADGTIIRSGRLTLTSNASGGFLYQADNSPLYLGANMAVANAASSSIVIAGNTATPGNVAIQSNLAVTGNVTGSNIVTTGIVSATSSLNTAGNINFTNAEATDTARIFANVSGATTSLVLEVSDDLASDRIVLRHRYFATANTVDMLSAQLSGNTEANVTVTGNLIATNQVIASGNITGGNITSNGNLTVTGNLYTNNLNVVLNDISNQFDNITSVFALKDQQNNVTNIVNSRDIQVVVGGQTLSPYVPQTNWPFVGPFFTPYDSFRGFRVKSNSVSSNVIIYNSPAIGDQATITIINNSTTVQTRRYPYSPETIAFGD